MFLKFLHSFAIFWGFFIPDRVGMDFVPTRTVIENSKKIPKTKKNHYGFFSSQNGMGQAENERRKKIIVPIHSNPTRNREFQQNSKKKGKKLKNIIMASFQAKTG